MNKSKCPVCNSSHTIKYGIRNGTQTYKCSDCGYRFRNSRLPDDEAIWQMYQKEKQTIAQIAEKFNVSQSTIKRRLQNVVKEWRQPDISGSGFVHMDTTYWGHNWGILLCLDHETGTVLYLSFIKHETVADYLAAISSIVERGFKITGIVIDGVQSLFRKLAPYRIQMCQFHMSQIIKRYLTQNPKLLAARALKELMSGLKDHTEASFTKSFDEWKSTWREVIERRSILKDGKSRYRHRRLRSAMLRVEFYQPYLFTYQNEACKGMPNTNNRIEGTFTDLKKHLNIHCGMTEMNRKRFICGFLLA